MSKGLSGELNTSARLKATLDESLYHYHHDIIVPFKNGSAQIDHLVVSPFGLFIIETKNLAGWIYGSSDKAKWTQVLFKTKHQFQNPLRQTFRQKKVIASYLRIREKDIHPIKRKPIPVDKIKRIQKLCMTIDDEMRWLIALISDTGMRLGEAARLHLDDIRLNEHIPILI